MGAAGTGKTSVVKVAEALVEHFLGSDVVGKCAPSNTAARLFKGDTVHSCWQLASERNSERKHLARPALTKLQKRWGNKEIQFVDEISMLSPEQLAEGDWRNRAAKKDYEEPLGGIATVASGDMLQLPPVQRPSLAEPLSKTGKRLRSQDENSDDDDLPDNKRQATAAHRAGLELWHQFRSVVVLTLNVRAPGPLGEILAEMRNGPLSTASMELLKGRKIGYQLVDGKAVPLPPGAADPRLTQPPFSTNQVHYVVAVHKLRSCQAFQNAMLTARSLGVPVFVVKAWDVADKPEERHLFTQMVRDETLEEPSLSKTKNMPGILPLFVGMTLNLLSKYCVHLCLTHGCEVLLEQIIFAPDEVLPENLVAGPLPQVPLSDFAV